MKKIIVLDGKLYVQEKANNIIAKDGALYACDYEPDSNPENWRTINGAHVHIDNEGNIDGGAGGKFNGNGAVPRSMFPDTDSAERRKQKKQAEARAKQQAEQHKKEVEAAREQRKQERAEASRYKQEREAQLKQERVEQKQKFDELRNSYWAEKDEKRKKAIMKELKAAAQNYEQKFGINPSDDKIRTQKRSDETKPKETSLQKFKRWENARVDGMKTVAASNGKFTSVETHYPDGRVRKQYYESGRWTDTKPRGLAITHGHWQDKPLKIEIKE